MYQFNNIVKKFIDNLCKHLKPHFCYGIRTITKPRECIPGLQAKKKHLENIIYVYNREHFLKNVLIKK